MCVWPDLKLAGSNHVSHSMASLIAHEPHNHHHSVPGTSEQPRQELGRHHSARPALSPARIPHLLVSFLAKGRAGARPCASASSAADPSSTRAAACAGLPSFLEGLEQRLPPSDGPRPALPRPRRGPCAAPTFWKTVSATGEAGVHDTKPVSAPVSLKTHLDESPDQAVDTHKSVTF